ncbi:MAG TPA: peptide deformylase [Candidatus Dormibacteraeota bacterium]|jgi:peptide deformylase|nr:peptide deformylase [Candidatus Dormibacteraeota bacterium]
MAGAKEMRELGIRQRGDPVLGETCLRFDLPAEAELAVGVERRLAVMIERLAGVHVFAKGMGLAAPQIGIPRAAAMLRPPDGRPPFLLLNPRVTERSAETDEQFEGCLSFFDVRGRVVRPVRITVAHAAVDGTPLVTRYETGMARLVLHEIDHLAGTLYADRMSPGSRLIPLDEYREGGRAWEY